MKATLFFCLLNLFAKINAKLTIAKNDYCIDTYMAEKQTTVVINVFAL